MRHWHRWIASIIAVMMSYWVVTGLIMATYDVSDPVQTWAIEGGGPGARLNDWAVTAAPIPDPSSVAQGVAAAQAASGALAVASVDLRMTGGTVPRLQFAEASGERTTMKRFYAATGESMPETVADHDYDANLPPTVRLRNTLKAIHRGNIAGLTGQTIGLIVGLSLFTLAVTGTILYFQLWSARRASRKPAFFWQARESIWRRLHRWIGVVSAALLLNIALSGSFLAYEEIQLHLFLDHGIGFPLYPRPSPLPPVSTGSLPSDFNGMLQTSYRAALASHPGSGIAAIQLVVRDGDPKGLVTLGGSAPQTLAFNPVSGAPVSDWATGGVQVGNGYYADFHQFVKRLHRGDVFGFRGRYVDIASGLALLYLVISSFLLYFDLYQRRRNTGRKGFFWK
jgi:uncharacterized iron-regulated membrane protein